MMNKINVMSRKLIKPCTPTPLHLNKYKLSFIDELSPQTNINVILFYQTPIPTPQLEESLSNILPQFYPLAGRYLKNDHTVDCNDEGAEFVLAEAPHIELADLIVKINEPLNDLLSRQFYEVDGPTDPLLSVQITRLNLGHLAIGISVSHRIFDASSLATFVAAWSNVGGNDAIAPSFDSPSLFPGKNLGGGVDRPRTRDPNMVVKRVVFSKEDIDKLRSKIKTKNIVFVSRVRLVSAFIAKALMRMDRAKNFEKRGVCCFKIIQPVNIRARTIPPLPKHSCGNLAIPSATRVCMDAHKEEVERFEDLIYKLGEAIGETITFIGQTLALGKEEGRHKLISDSTVNINMSTDIITLVITDRSKFGFYEADFGSGNQPVLVGLGAMPLQYATTLLANKNGGGIEAWVNVNRADLPCFETYVHLSQMESEDF